MLLQGGSYLCTNLSHDFVPNRPISFQVNTKMEVVGPISFTELYTFVSTSMLQSIPCKWEYSALQLVIAMAAMRWEPSFHAHNSLQEIIHSHTQKKWENICQLPLLPMLSSTVFQGFIPEYNELIWRMTGYLYTLDLERLVGNKLHEKIFCYSSLQGHNTK